MDRRDHVLLRIEGMTCDGCARHVTEALKGVSGIEDAQVPGWQSGKAVVIAGGEVSDRALIEAVRRADYRAIVQDVTSHIIPPRNSHEHLISLQ